MKEIVFDKSKKYSHVVFNLSGYYLYPFNDSKKIKKAIRSIAMCYKYGVKKSGIMPNHVHIIFMADKIDDYTVQLLQNDFGDYISNKYDIYKNIWKKNSFCKIVKIKNNVQLLIAADYIDKQVSQYLEWKKNK